MGVELNAQTVAARVYASITFLCEGDGRGVCVCGARLRCNIALRETAPIVAHAFECLSDAFLVSKGDNGGGGVQCGASLA